MKHINLKRTLTAALLTLVVTVAYSQSNAMTAKIPFAFRAVGSELPAGRYRVAPMSGTAGSSVSVELLNRDSGKSILIPVKAPATTSKGERPRLIFQCVEREGCSLASLWSGTGDAMEFATPALTASQKERRETIFLDRAKAK